MEKPDKVVTVPTYHSVHDIMPHDGQSVMTCGRVRWSNGECPKWFTNEFWDGEFSNFPESVQFWFPLPEIPEEVKTGGKG